MKSQSREIGCLNYCCRGACQISKRPHNSKHKSRGFETSRDLTIRLLSHIETGPGRLIDMGMATKPKSCCNANFVLTGGTGGCNNDSLRCHHWRQSWYDNWGLQWVVLQDAVVVRCRDFFFWTKFHEWIFPEPLCRFLWFKMKLKSVDMMCHDHSIARASIRALSVAHSHAHCFAKGVGQVWFVDFSVKEGFDFTKVDVSSFESHKYLPDVTTVELRNCFYQQHPLTRPLKITESTQFHNWYQTHSTLSAPTKTFKRIWPVILWLLYNYAIWPAISLEWPW